MKKTGKGADWNKIKAAYQRGEGSCRVLADRFGVTFKAIESRCFREKWRAQKKEIAGKVQEKVIDSLSLGAIAWVNATIERANRARGLIDASIEQFATDEKERPVIDLLNVNTMLQAETKADDMARRALGLPDTPSKVEVEGSMVINVISPFKSPDGCED